MTRRLSALVSAAAGLLLAACGGAASSSQPSVSPSPKVSGTLTVLAAASLTGAFTKIGDDLRRQLAQKPEPHRVPESPEHVRGHIFSYLRMHAPIVAAAFPVV